MFCKEDCKFDTYKNIIRDVKESGKYMDYPDAKTSEAFVVLRHDIEFSIDRAFALSELEARNDFFSSYFVQITNNAYNALSNKNLNLLQEIKNMGHHIGLHYHQIGLTEMETLKKDILRQRDMLSEMLGFSIDRFSFHRPQPEYFKADLEIPGLLNTYSHHFFTYVEGDPRTTCFQ